MAAVTISFILTEEEQRRIETATNKTLEEVAVQLASAQHFNILQRARRGLGIDDKPMPGYRPMTVALKKARGRDTKVRNLTDRGTMLGDIHVVKDGVNGAKVLFLSAQQRLKAVANQKRAPWFGISPKDRDKLQAVVAALLGGQ